MQEITNHSGYYISEDGSVFNKKGKILSLYVGCGGYWCVHIGKRNYLLHRLLAIAFIPNPENKPTVNHRDGNRQNCSLDNLEWATYKEQIDHKRLVLGNTSGEFKCGLIGKDAAKSKKVLAIYPNGITQLFHGAAEASRKLGIGRTSIKNVLRGYAKETRSKLTFKYL